jgi:hypothetical protein
MWNDLTPNQRRGFNWAAKQRNAANFGGRNNWTGQEVALAFMQAYANELYDELSNKRLDRFKVKFLAMTPAEQTAFLQQHTVEDIE